MNFIKNSLNKLFGKTEETQPTHSQKSNTVNQDAQIPEEVLRDIFEITAQFIGASELPTSDSLKLQLYSYYKQATIGDCNTPKPAIYQFVAKSKWQSWNNLKGTSSGKAMKHYIATAIQVDPQIPAKMAVAFDSEQKPCEHHHHSHAMQQQREGSMMKMVQQKDFSGSYSHPYFKAIQKGDDLGEIVKELLIQKNNNPKVYPLHFAIDKEREDLVPKFLELLTVEDIEEMKDQEGTGILEYAELIENEVILELIQAKLGK